MTGAIIDHRELLSYPWDEINEKGFARGKSATDEYPLGTSDRLISDQLSSQEIHSFIGKTIIGFWQLVLLEVRTLLLHQINNDTSSVVETTHNA
jgi:hypothetical protein